MRIGIDARAAAEVPAGRGRYVRELLAAFARGIARDHELVCFARKRWDGPLVRTRGRWRLLATRDPLWGPHAGALANRECDVFLATNTYLATAVLLVPTVVVVYDLVVYEDAWQLPRGAAAERLTLPLAARRAAALVCISEATRAALVERFPSTASRAVAIPLAAEDRFARDAGRAGGVRARLGLDRPYVLALSTLEPRKNLPRLVDAFLALPDEVRGDHQLVLVGGKGWAMEELDARLAGHPGLVRASGFVADEDLPGLYAGATAFAYPSLQEGFGLPLLEAMAAGTPVLTSDVSSLPEVAGDAARYVSPTSVQSMRDGLADLLQDAALRDRLTALGRERAASFTWDRTARETLAVLERVGTSS